MNRSKKNNKLFCTLILAVGLFSCGACNAWHGGGGCHHGGGYYHGGGGYYHGGGWGWGGPTIIVGGGYYSAPAYQVQCQTVQQCYPGGQCFQQQICN